MSFGERNAWITSLASIIVAVWFAQGLVEKGSFDANNSVITAIVGFIILVVIAHIFMGIIASGASDTEDERDLHISRTSERIGVGALYATLLLILAQGMIDGEYRYTNIAYFGLLLTEIVRGASRIWLYRFGG